MTIQKIKQVKSYSIKTLKPIDRSKLQEKSCLKSLKTRLIRDDQSTHSMLIPGGMNFKESLQYKLTGEFPKSVTERWYQIFEPELKNISSNDEVVQVSKNVLRESGYFLDNHESVIDQAEHVGSTLKNIGHGFKSFVDDVLDKLDDLI